MRVGLAHPGTSYKITSAALLLRFAQSVLLCWLILVHMPLLMARMLCKLHNASIGQGKARQGKARQGKVLRQA